MLLVLSAAFSLAILNARAADSSQPNASELHLKALQAELEGKLPQALEWTEKALAASPQQSSRAADLLREKAMLLFALGKPDEAREPAARMLALLTLLRRADDRVEFHGPILQIAAEYEKRDLPALALEFFKASRAFSRRPVFVSVSLAQTRCKLGDTAQAREDLADFFSACKENEGLCKRVETAKAHLTAGSIDLTELKAESAATEFRAALAGPKREGKTDPKDDDDDEEEPAPLPPAVRAMAEYGLAEVARLQDKPAVAKTRYEKALALEPSLKALILAGQARLELDQGSLADAEKHASESYEARKAVPPTAGGATQLEQARASALLGTIRLRLAAVSADSVARLKDAEGLLTSARQAFTERLGAESAEATTARYHLALAQHLRGDADGARVELERIALLQEKLFGVRHRSAALARLSASRAELDQDHLFEAEAALKQARKLFSPVSPEAAEISQWLAVIELRRGAFASALSRLDEARKIAPLPEGSRLARAECLWRTGKSKDARKVLEDEALKDNPSAQALLAQILLAEEDAKDEGGSQEVRAEAKRLFQASLDSRKKSLGEKHPFTAQNLAGLGHVAADGGDLAEGIRLLESAATLREQGARSESWGRAENYLLLGRLYEKSSKPELALSYYTKANETFRRVYLPRLPAAAQESVDGIVRARADAVKSRL